MADQLVTPSELASFLQQDLDTATATLLIEVATGKIQSACGQRLIDATDTITLDIPWGWCDVWLDLPQLPVRSVASVLIDGTAYTDWYLRSQRLWRLDGWSLNASFPSQITVTYTHGYPDGAQGLQLARDYCLALAGSGYSNPSGATAEQIDDYRVAYAQTDARMQLTAEMRDRLRSEYGTPAYVTSSP